MILLIERGEKSGGGAGVENIEWNSLFPIARFPKLFHEGKNAGR